MESLVYHQFQFFSMNMYKKTKYNLPLIILIIFMANYKKCNNPNCNFCFERNDFPQKIEQHKEIYRQSCNPPCNQLCNPPCNQCNCSCCQKNKLPCNNFNPNFNPKCLNSNPNYNMDEQPEKNIQYNQNNNIVTDIDILE